MHASRTWLLVSFAIGLCISCGQTRPDGPVDLAKVKYIRIATPEEAAVIEKESFCGDAKGLMDAISSVRKHLAHQWDLIDGTENKTVCEIRLTIDESGKILRHEVTKCGDIQTLEKVLVAASPVPVPLNKCIIPHINATVFRPNY